MSEVKEIFAQLRQKIAEIGFQKFLILAADAENTVKTGYSRVKPVFDDNGNKLTTIPDSELVLRMIEAVTLEVNSSGRTAMIYLDGVEENKEAMRWYAYGNKIPSVGNPFLAAYKRLANSDTVDRILGENKV